MTSGVQCYHCGRPLFASYICLVCANEVDTEKEGQLIETQRYLADAKRELEEAQREIKRMKEVFYAEHEAKNTLDKRLAEKERELNRMQQYTDARESDWDIRMRLCLTQRDQARQKVTELQDAALLLLENIDRTKTADKPIMQVHVARQRVEALRAAVKAEI